MTEPIGDLVRSVPEAPQPQAEKAQKLTEAGFARIGNSSIFEHTPLVVRLDNEGRYSFYSNFQERFSEITAIKVVPDPYPDDSIDSGWLATTGTSEGTKWNGWCARSSNIWIIKYR